MGVGGGDTLGWSYSIGLWHTLRSPEVSVFGLGTGVAHRVLNVLGERIRDGEVLRPGRRSDVLEGLEVEIRPVRPTWYPTFFGAAVDFYQGPPLPIVQVCWPDKDGRFAWEPMFEARFQSLQPMLWLTRDEHPPGAWADEDPYAGWPFRTSLPYSDVRTTAGIAGGTERISVVVHHQDGTWEFLDAIGQATTIVQLRQIATEHPYVLAVADLPAGSRADLGAEGTWTRSPLR